jgi:hypothetical protein
MPVARQLSVFCLLTLEVEQIVLTPGKTWAGSDHNGDYRVPLDYAVRIAVPKQTADVKPRIVHHLLLRVWVFCAWVTSVPNTMAKKNTSDKIRRVMEELLWRNSI